jgi:uncharacterized phage-associated protein
MDITKSQKLLYTIIQELGGIDDKIKLAKFQYFSDFIHYAFHDKPISDITSIYEKRPYGPLSRSFNADLVALISSGLIQQKGKYTYSVKKKTDNDLSKDEIKTIKYVVEKYAKYAYDILADITHKQIPYLSATEGGVVEYNTAYNLIDEYSDYQIA